MDKHDDREVTAHALKLVNTGDGLSKALKLDPVSLHMGDRVCVVVEAICTGHDYRPAIPGDPLGPAKEIVVLSGQTAVLTDNATVQRIIDRQRKRLNALAEIEGQRSIDDELEGPDDDDE